ncbi:putative ubiquitin carboxyl-terminal hydrolase MINDY-4 [Merluccius polli]|uniref:Ubiquitin carboxyl-terminal hydrolase MINDY n=1 Tax=Merluccius polli TaxID=89951 RepID=A0AA47NB11_MERPO|nr:putative ubiquitin carboxyl-terminal hydrolase MINDY-4 [Merluccius polli]
MVVSVEEVASSLVREFLSRKGLKRTIACMDEEFPRTVASINNRSDLRQVLQVEGLYRNNKALNSPLKTLLEIIVKSHVEGHKDDYVSPHDNPLRPSPSTNLNRQTQSHGDTGGQESTGEFASKMHQNARSIREDNCSLEPERQSAHRTCPPGDDSDTLKEQQSVAFLQENASFPRREREKAGNESALKSRTNRIRRGVLGGPVAHSRGDSHKKRQTRRTGLPPSLLGNEAGPPEHTGLSKGLASGITADQEARPECGSPGRFTAPGLLRDRQQTWSTAESKNSPGRQDVVKNRRPKSSTYLNMDSLQSFEMVLDDFDYDEELQELSKVSLQPSIPQHSYRSCPMDIHTATELKEVLLGSGSRCFSAEWRNQGFSFSETPDLRYGIVQKKGGPCGVLASVQACVLQKLLFDVPNPGSVDLGLRPSDTARRRCLVLAAAEVLWRAGEHKTATLAIISGRSHFVPSGYYKSEGLLEKVTCFTADNLNALQCLLGQHIQQFESGSFGCLLLSVSAVLSRSIAKVREDMDVSSNTLIGAHGYCTQELVNLFLCGQAVSNVFDDNVELDSGDGSSTLLKGIKHHCNVGSRLKTPLFPIWVVCSESHFSTLFGLHRELVTNQDSSRQFDLYYYDGLANQQEEIRLSVTLLIKCLHFSAVGIAAAFHEDNDPDLTPPLEQCIRTKWKDAIVNWNDTEPIL